MPMITFWKHLYTIDAIVNIGDIDIIVTIEKGDEKNKHTGYKGVQGLA